MRAPPPLLVRAGLRHLGRHRWQTALTVVGVAGAVAVVVGIDLANAAARRALRDSVDGVAGRATHEVVGGSAGVDETLYVALRREGWRRLAPIVEARLALDEAREGGPRSVRLLGVDPFAEEGFGRLPGALRGDGPTSFFTQPGAVAIGAPLAAELGLGPGDRLAVRAAGRRRELEVVAVLAPRDDLERQATLELVVADLATAQEVLERPGRLDRLDVVLPEEDAELRLALERRLPAGTTLRPKAARRRDLEAMTRAFHLNLRALGLLAFVVGAFLVYHSMTFSVLRRREEIGTLRALGVTRGEVFALVVAEAALVGAAGTAVGVGLGRLLAEGLLVRVVQTIDDLYVGLRSGGIGGEPLTLAGAAALGWLGSVAAALAPAHEATTTPPRTVQRRSAAENRAGRAAPRLAAGGLALLAAAGGLLLLPGRSLLAAFAAVFALVAGAALLVPAATRGLSRALGALAAPLGPLAALAARGVGAHLSRTGPAVAALTVAVATTIGVTVMVASFRSTLVDWLGTVLAADVFVSPPDLGRGGGAVLRPETVAAALTAPGVAGATTTSRTHLDEAKGRLAVAVVATDRAGFDTFRLAGGDADEAWRLFSRGGLLVSESLAYRRRLGRGETWTLPTDDGPRAFPIAAVVLDYRGDSGTVTLARSTWERHWRRLAAPGSLALRAAPGVEAAELRRRLRDRLAPLQDVDVVSNRELRASSLAVFERTFAVTAVLRRLAVAVAFVGVLAAISGLALERERELAVLRAVGATPRQVLGLVLGESALTGLVAGLLALPLGLALAVLLVEAINRRSFGWTLRLELGAGPLLEALALSTGVAFVAAFLPARRAARAVPARALRSEE